MMHFTTRAETLHKRQCSGKRFSTFRLCNKRNVSEKTMTENCLIKVIFNTDFCINLQFPI